MASGHAYCTDADIYARIRKDALVLMCDDDGDGVIDTDILTAAMYEAAGQVDLALARYTTVPLSSYSQGIQSIAGAITCAILANRGDGILNASTISNLEQQGRYAMWQLLLAKNVPLEDGTIPETPNIYVQAREKIYDDDIVDTFFNPIDEI